MQIYCRKCNLHKNASSSGHAAATRSFFRSCLHAFIQQLLPFVHPSVPHEATSIIGRHTSHQHHTVSKSRYSTGNMYRGWGEEWSTSDNNENNLAKMTILYYTRFTTTQDSLCLGKYTIGHKKKENNGKQETKDSGINNETSMMLIIIWLLVYRCLLCPSIPAVQQHPSNHGTKYK